VQTLFETSWRRLRWIWRSVSLLLPFWLYNNKYAWENKLKIICNSFLLQFFFLSTIFFLFAILFYIKKLYYGRENRFVRSLLWCQDEYCEIESLVRFLPYGGVWYTLYSPRFNKFRNELLKLGGPSREAAWQDTWNRMPLNEGSREVKAKAPREIRRLVNLHPSRW